MDDLDKLSNNELRQYMLQCGFPNTPITDTTRKILIKRLKNHLNNKKTILKKQVSSITRFSSDEESDIDQNNRNEVDSSAFRRKTYYPSSNSINSTSGLTNNNYSPSKILNNIQNSNYFTSRFSSPSITSTSTTTSTNLNNNNTTSYDKYKISPTSRIYVSPTYHYQDNNKSYQNNNETYDASDYSDAEYNSNSSYNNNLKSSSSNFTRRLLSLRNETLANSKPSQPKLQNNSEQNIYFNNSHHNVPLVNLHSGLSRRSYYKDKRTSVSSDYDTNALSPSTAFKNVLASLNEHFAVQQHFIPCLLVSVAIIFFVSLSFLYINITPNLISTVTEKSVQVNFCQSPTTTTHSISSSTINLNQNSVSCVYKNQVNDALEIIKFLIPILQEKSQHYYCKDRSEEFALNSRSVINMIFENISKNGKVLPDIRKITQDLHNAEYIIENNPQWAISHVDKFGEPLSFSEVVKLRSTKENYYAMLNPSLPLLCSIHNKLEKFFILIGSLAIALILGGTSLMLYRIFINYRANRQRSVFNLIEEIINNLMNKAEKNPNDKSVVVNHLRDMLIPVHKRKELDWAWNKAIHYLRQNESRVVFEMGIVNGEDCEMIKWIDTVLKDQNFSSSILSENKKSSVIKRWESPAFNDKTNKIKNPPTPCLKIRQMFDKSEANDSNLEQVIHDAILEKVGLNCKIYDIQIDKQSCCVYVRCASESDAGIVHDEINGWWFDKRLVSIKFLRLERYLARFPNSYAGPKCLYPSNSKKLSISNVSMNVNNYDDDDDDDTDEEQT